MERHRRIALTLLLLCGPAVAREPIAVPRNVRFDRDVQPLLTRCVACHGPGKARAGLRLDSSEAATEELDSGNHAIVPGKPEQSELLRRVGAADPKKRMPPRGVPLSAAQVELLRRWIAAGAEYRLPWAYLPPKRQPVPVLRESRPRRRAAGRESGLAGRMRPWIFPM